MTDHCCKNMDFFLKEESVDIYYSDRFRSYGIGMKNGTSAEQAMVFCPWCGKKLPKDLGDEWFFILEEQYNLDVSVDKSKIPEEFKTDEWWKKRGL